MYGNDGRTWSFDESLKPEIKNDVLYLNYIGSIDNSIYLSVSIETFDPRDAKQKPIPINGRKNVIIEFNDLIRHKVYLHSSISNGEGLIVKQTINLQNQMKIILEIPNKGKELMSIVFYFTGEQEQIGIKHIYLE